MKKEDRLKVYNMFNGHCAYCGKEIAYKDMQVDHIEPAYHKYSDAQIERWNMKRGADTLENYYPSCRACNFRKGTSTIEQFRTSIKKQCEDIVKRSFQVRQSIDYGLIKIIDKPVVFYFEKIKEAEK